MADARPAAALFLEAIPQVMCHLRKHLVDTGSGLTVAQFRCLKMVQRNPEVGLGELADANGVSAPAMSKLVDGLVAMGHLERRPDAADRRRLQLRVSPAGRRKLDAVSERLKTQLAERLAGLPAAELAVLERALANVNASLATAAVTA